MSAVMLTVVVSALWVSVGSPAATAAVSTPETIQAVYAVPADVTPVTGRLAASATSISVVQQWFSGQTGGEYPVFNEVGGSVSVELLTLSKTRSEIESMSMNALDTLLINESDAAFSSVQDSELFVYLEAPLLDGGACGYAGRIVVIVMDNCRTYPSTSARWPYGDTYLVAHELTHLLGAVASCAPNHIPGGHLDGDNRDVLFMGSGGRDWNNLMLDPGNDDYYNHGRSDCPDIADSPLLGTSGGSDVPTTPTGPVICDGREATIVGTTGDDVLVGTSGADVIAGLQGNDTIDGLGGDDIICAGIGNDIVYGGTGFDIIYGAQGNDTIHASSGPTANGRNDVRGARMFGGAGNDTIHGSNKWDRMQGGSGVDQLYGYEGRDWMRGGADADRIYGGANVDDLHGGNGNDQIVIEGADTVRGGAGARDVCVLQGGSQPTLLRSCERVS